MLPIEVRASALEYHIGQLSNADLRTMSNRLIPSGDSEAIVRISYILTSTPSLAVFAAEIANQKLYGARNGW